MKRLSAEGLDAKTAGTLLDRSGAEEVERQLAWLDARQPSRSRAGMLRRAIEERWPEPAAPVDDGGAGDFARHLYAGLHGQAGAPVAVPSAADLEAASLLLARLRTQSDAAPADLGRSLGRRAASAARPPASLAAASRSHGDAYLRDLTRAHATPESTAERATSPADLRALEVRLRRERPELHVAFEADRARRRQALLNDPALRHGRLRKFLPKYLERHDAEPARLEELLAFVGAHPEARRLLDPPSTPSGQEAVAAAAKHS